MARSRAFLLLLAVVCMLACASGESLRAQAIRLASEDAYSNGKPSCLTYADSASCLQHGCGWCSNDVLGEQCMAKDVAKLVPTSIATCELPGGDDAVNQQLAGGDDAGGDTPKAPPASCSDNKEKADCLDLGAQEGDCAWCKGDKMTPRCMTAKKAKWIPEPVAHCKMPSHKQLQAGGGDDAGGKKPKAPVSCGDNKEKANCLDLGAQEGDCAWCKGDFMPASCVATKAAEWIPETVAHCKMPKKTEQKQLQAGDDADAGGKKPKAPVSCGDNKEKADCLDLGAQEGDCAWCKGDFMPASCVATKAAEWIPETVAHCKMPKKSHKKDDGANALDKKHKDKGKGGADWPSGGGDWPSGGGDWPSGGGSKGGGSPGGQGTGCMAEHKRKHCLRAKDASGGCAWCVKGFMGSNKCVSETSVKYLPKMVADCEMPKKKDKKSDAVATS